MTQVTNNDAAPHELSMEELDSVDGGRFSLGGWLKAVVTGAAVGGLAGPAGAVGGAVFGSVGYFLF
jgi:hypothetical protein